MSLVSFEFRFYFSIYNWPKCTHLLFWTVACNWVTVSGYSLRPTGQTKTIAQSPNVADCQQKCLQETSFTCAAVNYRAAAMQCQLLERNDSTDSTQQAYPNYQYSVRPACAASGKNWYNPPSHWKICLYCSCDCLKDQVVRFHSDHLIHRLLCFHKW